MCGPVPVILKRSGVRTPTTEVGYAAHGEAGGRSIVLLYGSPMVRARGATWRQSSRKPPR